MSVIFGLGGAAVALGAVVGAFMYGVNVGKTDAELVCETNHAKMLEETNAAFNTLVNQSVEADARATRERQRRQEETRERIKTVQDRNRSVPDRGCQLTDRVRDLYRDAICSHPRNAARPECVSASVPAERVPTGEWGE